MALAGWAVRPGRRDAPADVPAEQAAPAPQLPPENGGLLLVAGSAAGWRGIAGGIESEGRPLPQDRGLEAGRLHRLGPERTHPAESRSRPGRIQGWPLPVERLRAGPLLLGALLGLPPGGRADASHSG